MNDIRPGLMPKARKDRLIVKELADETLVYDLDSDKAHCLNETAATVWKNCNGKNTVPDIAAVFGKRPITSEEQRIVWLALEQLESSRLLDGGSPKLSSSGMNRRQVIRTLGVTAIALPVVVSIVAPIAAEAQSGCSGGNRPAGCPCSNNNNCQSNSCVSGRCT